MSCRELLGYTDYLQAHGTIPVGVPEKDLAERYRRPIEQMVHFNGYEMDRHRSQEMVDFYVGKLRPFAMYRGSERLEDWEDFAEKLGDWAAAFTGPTPSKS